MSDPILIRYGAIARNVHELLDDPALLSPDPARVTPEIRLQLSDAVYRLGLYLAAMPAARTAPTPQEFEALMTEFDRAFPAGEAAAYPRAASPSPD